MNDFTETVAFYRKRLPHREVNEGRYFLTLRVDGSIPHEILEEARRLNLGVELMAENSSLLNRQCKLFRLIENVLHSDKISIVLINSSAPKIIYEAIDCYEKKGIWKVYEYVIMPNYMHLFFGDKRVVWLMS